jgi:hypothetical protein
MNNMRRLKTLTFTILLLIVAGCNNAKEAADLVDGIERKPIPRSKLAVNAFFNDSRFGSIEAQMNDVTQNLGLRRIRVLARWDTGSHPSPGASPTFGLLEDILRSAPSKAEILVVSTGVPAWMSNQSNWINGNPRVTYVELWLKPLLRRLRGYRAVKAVQVWNEPNSSLFPENDLLQVRNSSDNYAELMALARNAVDSEAGNLTFVMGATTAINQNYPDTLNYNRALRDSGVDSLVDVWAIHYYGQQFENVIRDGGVRDFLNGISKPIWITESGIQGSDKQLKYGEETWPYLLEKIPAIDRIYIYQYTEGSPAESSYGLRSLGGVSDLYNWLAGG